MAGQPDAARRRDEPRQVPGRDRRPGEQSAAVQPRLRVDLRRVARDGRGDRRHLAGDPRGGAGAGAEAAVPGAAARARRRRRLPRGLGDDARPGVALRRPRRRAAAEGVDGVRQRRPGGQGGPAGPRRRLHGGADAEVPRRRRAAGGRDVRDRAVRLPPGRLQRPGHRHAGGAGRRVAAARRRLPRVPARRPLQQPRLRALRAHPGRPRLARRRRGGAVRRGAHPGQRAQVRRRRASSTSTPPRPPTPPSAATW